MKNFSKEFQLNCVFVAVGTHWQDWSLPLRVQFGRYKNIPSGVYSTDIVIDFLCFTINIEIFRGKK